MNKTQIKKAEKKIASLRCLGMCKCGGSLVLSVLAPKTERFTITCTDCGSVSDARFPKAGDMYALDGVDDNPIKLVCRIYEQEQITITDKDIEDTPISKLVNTVHGDV